MPYNIEDVIKWFLSRESMSPKKLQKILYYAYSWTLTLENEDINNLDVKLFDEEFEAWVHGPVIPKVYYDYRDYGYQDIPRFTGEVPEFDTDIESVLEQVWDVYGGYSGNELENLTHQESPWINAREGFGILDRCNNRLSDEDIFNCYVERLED